MIGDSRLTIAIPTFNFGRFIGATLDSIIPQLDRGVDIIVVDGASTDDTALVVRDRMRRSPRLAYHQLPSRGGIDRDIATAVDLARGDHVWLFSADDIMKPEAVATVLRALVSCPDVVLLAHSNCTIDMDVLAPAHPVFTQSRDRCADLADDKQRLDYFGAAYTTEAFFSFMSGLVIRRARWNAAPADDRWLGSCWAHAARLLGDLQSGLVVHHVATPLLDRRGDNDSFASGGTVRRYAIAIDGYCAIGDRYFGRSSTEAFHIRRVLRNEFTLRFLLFAKHLTRSRDKAHDRALLDRLVARLYGDPGGLVRLTALLYKFTPTTPYRAGVALVRSLQRVIEGRGR